MAVPLTLILWFAVILSGIRRGRRRGTGRPRHRQLGYPGEHRGLSARYGGMSRRYLPILAALALLAGCASYDPANPLNGRWSLQAPIGAGFTLGTYSFYRDSAEILGIDQEVDYAIDGNRIQVIPRGFGPTLSVRMIDANTAELRDPLTGSLLTLRRLRENRGVL